MDISSEDRPRFSRRKVLAGLGAAGLGALAGWALNKPKQPSPDKEEVFLAPHSTNTSTSVSSATPEPITPLPTLTPETKSFEPPSDNVLLNEILALPLDSSDRLAAEEFYVRRAQTKEQIDKGFWVIDNQDLREKLLTERYKLRQKDPGNIFAKDTDLIGWTAKNDVNNEVLGMCFDTYSKAGDIIGSVQKYLKTQGGVIEIEGIKYSLDTSINPANLMINPGGLSALVCDETTNFTNIGQKSALSQINSDKDAFPSAPGDLVKLCEHLTQDTGLKFQPENIPGSSRGDPKLNLSGGAIGLQFMPNQALALNEILGKANFKFNPFDPESALIGAWLYLALQKEAIGKDGEIVIRKGYRLGNDESSQQARQEALMTWNPYKKEVTHILKVANLFYDQFIKPNPGILNLSS